MNFFYLDTTPQKCAQFHNDKHCVKMISEYTQMLSDYLVEHYKEHTGVHLGQAHKSHPVRLWLNESVHNAALMAEVLGYLHVEYSLRYNKVHSYNQHMDLFLSWIGYKGKGSWREATPPAVCIGERMLSQINPILLDNRTAINVVLYYRQYYIEEKQHIAKWYRGRCMPYWYVLADEDFVGTFI